MGPSLSVIIPTYNRSGYVRTCLNALRECGVPDLEIIVSDDGSTDDTRDVVATFPGVLYLWHPNEGTPSTARNRGFAISQGRYVGFLDCDDLWLPGGPAEAVRLLDSHPQVDVLFGESKVGNPDDGYFSWIESAGQDEIWKLPASEPEPGLRVFERIPFLRRMAVRNPVFIGACIMRRAVFEQSGMFDPALCGAADWELWLRMAQHHTFGLMKKPLGVWTQHHSNMSGDKDGMSREFCSALQSFLCKRGNELQDADRAFVAERLHHHLFGYAYKAYSRGEYAEARRRFGDLLKSSGFGMKGVFYWTFCSLPPSVVASIRRMKGGETVAPSQGPAPHSRAITKPREAL